MAFFAARLHVTLYILCKYEILWGFSFYKLLLLSSPIFPFFILSVLVCGSIGASVHRSQIDIHWSVPPSCHFVNTITVWSSAKQDI